MPGSCSKKGKPKKKRKETPEAVRGLLRAADKARIGLSSEPRHLAANNIDELPTCKVTEFGQYQGRVVLVALAAELALKFAYELHQPGKTATGTHDLNVLFTKLGKWRPAIEDAYQELLKKREGSPPAEWCETASGVFKECHKAFDDWRYILEEGKIPTGFVMRATYLGLAAASVVEAACSPAPQE